MFEQNGIPICIDMPVGKTGVVSGSGVKSFGLESLGILSGEFLIADNNRRADATLAARVIDVLAIVAFRFFGEFCEKGLLEPPCMPEDIA